MITRPSQHKSIYTVITSFILFFFIIAFQIIAIEAGAAQLPADNFNDNAIGDMWELIEGDEPTKVWLEETNQRLEARSTAGMSESFTAYVPNQWQLSTSHDFSMQIDWYYLSMAIDTGLFFGVRVQNQLDETYIDLNVDIDDNTGFLEFSCEASINGTIFYNYDMSRAVNDGVFYVSYDSTNDSLYLSINGYWRSEDPENGDWVLDGILQGN